MRYELNFDEDKVNDVLDKCGASYDLKGCCGLLNEQQSIIEEKNNVIRLMGAFIKSNGFSIDDFNEWISNDWHNVGDK